MTSSFDFDSMVRATRPQLVRYVSRLVGEADAEDVVQIVLSNAAWALSTFRGDASPRTWLFRIATNAAYDWNRAHRIAIQEPLELASEEDEGTSLEDASQERLLVREEMSQCVGDVLRGLPESYQVVLALSDCEELSDREVAEVLGASVGATKIRLHRARTKMKEALECACSFYRDAENTLCCDRKEKATESAYPLDRRSRLQIGSRIAAGSSELLNEETTMSTDETLPIKQRHLIGIGAALAAGCEPCTASYVASARAEGACERGVRFAIEKGLEGRDASTVDMSDFANETFAHPELDAAFRSERALLGALIGVAAAIASNAASSLKSRIDAARSLGATDSIIRAAVAIAETAKRGAENATVTALNTALGRVVDAEAPSCCGGRASDTTTRTDNGRDGNRTAGQCDCSSAAEVEFETVRIEKTKSTCSLCEDYARGHSHKPIVVMSCEGACLRGEISRQAANHLCHVLAPEKTVRLCLGGAFTKDAGQRNLVRYAVKVVALEGCSIRCASRMMRGHLPELAPEVILTDSLCEFDHKLFGLDAIPTAEVQVLGKSVAIKVATRL